MHSQVPLIQKYCAPTSTAHPQILCIYKYCAPTSTGTHMYCASTSLAHQVHTVLCKSQRADMSQVWVQWQMISQCKHCKPMSFAKVTSEWKPQGMRNDVTVWRHNLQEAEQVSRKLRGMHVLVWQHFVSQPGSGSGLGDIWNLSWECIEASLEFLLLLTWSTWKILSHFLKDLLLALYPHKHGYRAKSEL